MIGFGLIQKRTVGVVLHRFEDEGGVGRRILRLIFAHGFKIAGIGDDGGVLLELFELVHDGDSYGYRSVSQVELTFFLIYS